MWECTWNVVIFRLLPILRHNTRPVYKRIHSSRPLTRECRWSGSRCSPRDLATGYDFLLDSYCVYPRSKGTGGARHTDNSTPETRITLVSHGVPSTHKRTTTTRPTVRARAPDDHRDFTTPRPRLIPLLFDSIERTGSLSIRLPSMYCIRKLNVKKKNVKCVGMQASSSRISTQLPKLYR